MGGYYNELTNEYDIAVKNKKLHLKKITEVIHG